VLTHVVSATSMAEQQEEEEEEVADEHPIITASAEKRKYSQNVDLEAQDQQEETVDATAAPSLRRNVSSEVDPSTRTTAATQNKRHCNVNSSSPPSPAHST
jgi:hypothetical protein